MYGIIFQVVNLLVTLVTYLLGLLLVMMGTLKVRNWFTKGKCKNKARLDGKVVLITGGNSGIGLETARDLAKRGAKIVIASRDEKKSKEAVEDIIATTGNDRIEHKHLDLGNFSSVRKFAEEFKKEFDRLDILINNSGTGGLKHKLTEDQIDIVTQINYFGPFLLTNLLLDTVIKSKPSKIIIVSSKAHLYGKVDLEDLRCHVKKPWYTIYANTKLYNVLWAKALSKKVPEGVTVNALHPGLVKTDIFNRFGPVMRKIVLAFIGSVYKSPEEGAQTTIHLAVSEEVEHVTGSYFVDCQLSEESKEARREDFINDLWEKSLLITNT